MKQFKSITLTVNKNKKPDNNLPDFNMTIKDGEKADGTANFLNVGGGWKKQDKNGQTYMSLGLANAFDKENNPITYQNQNGQTVQRQGYVLVDEIELRELMKKVTLATGEAFNGNIPF